MDDEGLKQWKLVQGMLGMTATVALVAYVLSGNFKAQEWFPFLPPSPPPDTLIYHADAMRQAYRQKEFSIALSQAEWVLLRDKNNAEAIRTRAACLLRVGRFEDAEKVFRGLAGKDKKDISSRLALATALRGQSKDDAARMILIRITQDPNANAEQVAAARASLNAMDFKDPIFADQPTPEPRLTPKIPAMPASPSPEPLVPLTMTIPGLEVLSAAAQGIRPTPTPLGIRPRQPAATPAPPQDSVAPVTLPGMSKPEPKGTPEPGEIEIGDPENPNNSTTGTTTPLEIPAPDAVTPPVPHAPVGVEHRILPATAPTTGKKLPSKKPLPQTKKPTKKQPTLATKKKRP